MVNSSSSLQGSSRRKGGITRHRRQWAGGDTNITDVVWSHVSSSCWFLKTIKEGVIYLWFVPTILSSFVRYLFNPYFELQLFFYAFFYVRVPYQRRKNCAASKLGPLPWRSRDHGGNRLVLASTWLDCRAACVNRFLTSRAIGWVYFF